MSNKEVTILIPNYKTPDITKICLRLIRKHTDFSKVEVIVVDNHSNDASLAYLKTLSWINLIERKPKEDESGPISHSRALDLALEQVKTPFVLSIHTDTFVKHDDWIKTLIEPFKQNPQLAGVGSWKLEYKSKVKMLGYHAEQLWKYWLFKLFNYKNYNPERLDFSARYLRSHCAMYKTAIIKTLNTSFSDGVGPAGKTMHRKMVEAGYEMLFLDSKKLGEFLDHLNHATMILNPSLSKRKKNLHGENKIKKMLRGINASAILKDTALDL